MSRRDENKHRTDLAIEANKAAASEAARLHGLLGLAIRKLPTAAADASAWRAAGGEAFDLAAAIINALNLPADEPEVEAIDDEPADTDTDTDTEAEPEAPATESEPTPLPAEPPAPKKKTRR